MYSSRITEYLTPMFFKGDRKNKIPDLEVIGLHQDSFIDQTKKLEIRNQFGIGSASICNYLHKFDETNVLTLIQKVKIPDELFNKVDNFQKLDFTQSLVLKLERKVLKSFNLILRMSARKDFAVDRNTVQKFILVLDNNDININCHQNLIRLLEDEINNEFDQVTCTLNKVVSDDYMIEHYKKLLLEIGL